MSYQRPPRRRGTVTGVLLRFVSCGLISLSGGLLWRLTLAPRRVGVASALLGILCLLVGFIAGGLGWYLHDLRLRNRRPEAVDDERLLFSFVVFAVVPFAVLLLVGMVWTVSLVAGG
ncbi:MAG: hypothetical protein ABR541_06550 [Candidatus Dormibacteria bacterium]